MQVEQTNKKIVWFMTELSKPADTPSSCTAPYKLINIYPDNWSLCSEGMDQRAGRK